jgi:hypothetical protein
MAVEQEERTGVDESLEVATLRRQLAERDQIIAEKNQVIAGQSRQITELVEYKEQVHTILTNKDMSYRDRVIWGVTHIVHGEDIMAGRPFHANMVQIQTLAGSGKNGTGELFSAMAEAGGVKHEWDREKYTPEDADTAKWSSAVRITALPGNALVNTKAAAVRIRQREAAAQSATRRVERLISLAIEACPNCGCEDPEQAQTLLVPRCGQCGKLRNSDNLVATSALRILEIQEEPVQSEILEASSVQAVAVSSVPTSQDTPSVDDSASELSEPDDIKAQYEAQYGELSDRETSSAIPMIIPTAEDKENFRQTVAQIKAHGLLDTPHGQSSFTYREVLVDLQEIIKSKEPVKVYTLEWVRKELADLLNDLPDGKIEGSSDA